eukprot:165257_1
MCSCENGLEMDLQILIDLSCISDSECDAYTEGIAELFSSIKGEYAGPRIGVYTFSDNSVDEIVALNNTDYNYINYGDDPSAYKIGLIGKKALYNMIRNIDCSSGNINGQSTDTMSAINNMMEIFEYEEQIYLPSLYFETSRRGSITAHDFTSRHKKIALFSTCIASTGGIDENDICTAYSSENNRYIFDSDGINSGEVEITIINVIAENGNIPSPYSYLFCLTENDDGRQFYLGKSDDDGNNYAITYDAMVDRLECFRNEICDNPTTAPTFEPTLSPTTNPTTDPTSDPTTDPTTKPTPYPIPPEEPRCTCDNLGFELINLDYVGNGGCEPTGGCVYDPNCFSMEISKITPKECNPDCKTTKSDGYTPHIPDYIIIEPKSDCAITMTAASYFAVLQCALESNSGLTLPDDIDGWTDWGTIDYTEDCPEPCDEYGMPVGCEEYVIDHYVWVDGTPDPITGAEGLEIPLKLTQWADDGTYNFELCLWGVTNTVSTTIGWGFTVPGCSSIGGGIQYGMQCETNNIPDLCEDFIAYAHNTDGVKNIIPQNEPIDVLNPGNSPQKKPADSPQKTPSNHSLFAIYSAYSQWIFIIIMAIFSLNIFVCAYIKCIRSKVRNQNNKNYGFISKQDDDETGSSDGTDSEIDSDSDEQLIE